MRWTYDANANALYMTLEPGAPVRQAELADGIIVDLDAADRPVGVEVLGSGRSIEVAQLAAMGVPEDAVKVLSVVVAGQFPVVSVASSGTTSRQPAELLEAIS